LWLLFTIYKRAAGETAAPFILGGWNKQVRLNPDDNLKLQTFTVELYTHPAISTLHSIYKPVFFLQWRKLCISINDENVKNHENEPAERKQVNDGDE
jgi:hypothetical protein